MLKNNFDLVQAFKEDIQQDQVTKLEGNYSILLAANSLFALFSPDIEKYYGFKMKSTIFVSQGIHGSFFINLREYAELTKKAYEKFKNIGRKTEYIEDYYKVWKNIDELYDTNSPAFLHKTGIEALRLEIQKACDLFCSVFITTLGFESLDEGFISQHHQQIQSSNVSTQEFLEQATKTPFKSFNIRNDLALLKNYGKDREKLQYIFSDYALTPKADSLSDAVDNLIKEKGGIKKIESEIEESDRVIATIRREHEVFRERLSLEENKLFDFIQCAIEIRDNRKEPLQKIMTILSNSVREALSKLSIPEELAMYVFMNDLKTGIYGTSGYQQILEERSKGIIFYLSHDLIQSEESNVDKLKKQLFDLITPSSLNSGEVKGNIAFKGKVKGIAQLVLSKNDFSKFRDGGILVTSMTRPEFVPLMKKASAVVTDEGGVTCHAAIISRELRIPCVIGTKVATQIFKDGDMVEVDAEKGIVRIIK